MELANLAHVCPYMSDSVASVLVSTRDIASALRVSRRTAQRYCRRLHLPHVGSKWILPPNWADAAHMAAIAGALPQVSAHSRYRSAAEAGQRGRGESDPPGSGPTASPDKKTLQTSDRKFLISQEFVDRATGEQEEDAPAVIGTRRIVIERIG